jgi:hypothetical protein
MLAGLSFVRFVAAHGLASVRDAFAGLRSVFW